MLSLRTGQAQLNTRYLLGWMGLPLGCIGGWMALSEPLYLAGLVIAVTAVCLLFQRFEQTVLGLLFLRSSLDLFSAQQLPALFAIGVDALTLLYVGWQIWRRRRVEIDGFGWALFAWVAFEGIWVALMAIGGLGADQALLGDGIREWVRLFSTAMVYLLVMQLKDRIPGERVATLLFWCLAVPLLVAALQALPIENLPSILVFSAPEKGVEAGSRVNGTLGHPNSFATFALLFLALSLWRGQYSKQKLAWFGLAGCLTFFLVASQSLTGLVMLAVFAIAYFLPKLNLTGWIWATLVVILLVVVVSTGGGGRLGELSATPLANPDLTWSRAIALQSADIDAYRNSFNWRLTQWSFLLQAWHQHPWFGYGLATTSKISIYDTTAHNDYVRFIFEQGIVGITGFIAFLCLQAGRLIQLFRRTLPGTPQRGLVSTLLAVLIAMLVGMVAGNVMVHTALYFYWWTLFAVLSWHWPLHRSQRTVNQA